MRIAVIGSGISGLAAAWMLDRHAEVTLYERDGRVGGHSNTVQVPNGPPVDTGFIVYNERNYPELTAMFRHLGVTTQPSDMSFSASIGGGELEYAGDNLNTLFAQRWNFFSRGHWRMLLDITRFNRDAKRALRSGLAPHTTLGDFILAGRYGDELSRRYLLPMAAAIWSCPVGTMLKFPAASFLKFFENHGLLDLMDRPRWYTVTGGSRAYVRRLLEPLQGKLRLDTPVTAVRRMPGGIAVWDARGGEERYDRAVMASHADQTLAMLAGATRLERELLGAFHYQDNRAVLHSDPALMPKRRAVWASWNYLSACGHRGFAACGERPASEGGAGRGTRDGSLGKAASENRVSVTYWMNRLQSLPGRRDYFLSLNPLQEPDPECVIYETRYAHPVFTREAMHAQTRLAEIQGRDGIWFCGAWSGYGFHEDGLRSAVQAVESMGYTVPWRATPPAAAEDVTVPAWGRALAESR